MCVVAISMWLSFSSRWACRCHSRDSDSEKDRASVGAGGELPPPCPRCCPGANGEGVCAPASPSPARVLPSDSAARNAAGPGALIKLRRVGGLVLGVSGWRTPTTRRRAELPQRAGGSMPTGDRRFGPRLRRLRHTRSLRQKDLAGSEYSDAYISALEAGRRRPSGEAVTYLAGRLGVEPE